MGKATPEVGHFVGLDKGGIDGEGPVKQKENQSTICFGSTFKNEPIKVYPDMV